MRLIFSIQILLFKSFKKACEEIYNTLKEIRYSVENPFKEACIFVSITCRFIGSFGLGFNYCNSAENSHWLILRIKQIPLSMMIITQTA